MTYRQSKYGALVQQIVNAQTYRTSYNGQSLGSHTVLTVYGADEMSLQYHDTVVFDMGHDENDNRVVTLDNGGFWSATSKKKMNLAATIANIELTVYQERGEWFVCVNRDFDNPVPYENGMKIVID